MSYTATLTAQRADAKSAIAALVVSPDSDAPEQVAQVKAAKAAIELLIDSGTVVFDDSQDVYIGITGHAVSKDQTASGYNTISVSVSQVARTHTDA